MDADHIILAGINLILFSGIILLWLKCRTNEKIDDVNIVIEEVTINPKDSSK